MGQRQIKALHISIEICQVSCVHKISETAHKYVDSDDILCTTIFIWF